MCGCCFPSERVWKSVFREVLGSEAVGADVSLDDVAEMEADPGIVPSAHGESTAALHGDDGANDSPAPDHEGAPEVAGPGCRVLVQARRGMSRRCLALAGGEGT